MNLLDRLKYEIGAKRMAVAASILVLFNLLVFQFLVRPGQRSVQALENDLAKLQKFYEKMEFTDMDAISGVLAKQVQFLKKKSEYIFDNGPNEEEIPLIVSRLEELAGKSGLVVGSNVNSNNSQTKPGGSLVPIGISLSYNGSFEQVLRFLDNLEIFDKPLLINEFEVQRSGDNSLAGKFEFITMVTRSSNEKL